MNYITKPFKLGNMKYGASVRNIFELTHYISRPIKKGGGIYNTDG